MRLSEIRRLPWNLWWRQVQGILRLELKRNLFARRALWVYLLALAPVAFALLHSMVVRPGRCTVQGDANIFATMFQVYFLRLGIFFGCVGVFSQLIRGEFLARTLHYYLLAPVRREVLLVAKYVTGVVACAGLFSVSVVLAFASLGAHMGPAWNDFLVRGPGTAQMGSYLLVTLLACLGYGAVFLAAGLLVRNPMIPAAVLMVWESGNALLPGMLKKLSVIFYLKSLCPVDVPEKGPMALIAVAADPIPAYLAVPGLVLLSALLVAIAARRARKLEVSYAE
jgi:hypothetical protein